MTYFLNMRKFVCIFLAIALTFLSGCIPRSKYLPGQGFPITDEDIPPCEKFIMNEIEKLIGTPYKYGGTTEKGFDCSGFVRAVYRDALGIDLPHSSAEMWKIGIPIEKDELCFGDILFFKTTKRKLPSHSAIYLGDGRFAHANIKHGVCITSMEKTYYKKRYMGARRILFY